MATMSTKGRTLNIEENKKSEIKTLSFIKIKNDIKHK